MLLGMAVDPANGKKEGETCCESESSVMPFCCFIFLESESSISINFCS